MLRIATVLFTLTVPLAPLITASSADPGTALLSQLWESLQDVPSPPPVQEMVAAKLEVNVMASKLAMVSLRNNNSLRIGLPPEVLLFVIWCFYDAPTCEANGFSVTDPHRRPCNAALHS